MIDAYKNPMIITREKPPRLYVLLRINMSKTLIGVQAGHAVGAFSSNPELYALWGNRTLLHLGVSEEPILQRWHDTFLQMGAPMAPYRDPSWDFSLTAVAVFGTPEVIELVKDLPLVK